MVMRNLGGRRLHIIIPSPQLAKLNKLADATGITMAEHVRRAIDVYLNKIAEQSKAKP